MIKVDSSCVSLIQSTTYTTPMISKFGFSCTITLQLKKNLHVLPFNLPLPLLVTVDVLGDVLFVFSCVMLLTCDVLRDGEDKLKPWETTMSSGIDSNLVPIVECVGVFWDVIFEREGTFSNTVVLFSSNSTGLTQMGGSLQTWVFLPLCSSSLSFTLSHGDVFVEDNDAGDVRWRFLDLWALDGVEISFLALGVKGTKSSSLSVRDPIDVGLPTNLRAALDAFLGATFLFFSVLEVSSHNIISLSSLSSLLDMCFFGRAVLGFFISLSSSLGLTISTSISGFPGTHRPRMFCKPVDILSELLSCIHDK